MRMIRINMLKKLVFGNAFDGADHINPPFCQPLGADRAVSQP